ncbi:hypothetical protein L210DRAFT_3760991 [Boletus edulis BED1]|uniref:Uncharacterized protein n=1 Tax=Boletus edulis BED1 TaxID=1328754 RepID=A0AAD4BTL0_BOLED|nr:hypothetical protein L210DRAFT_3760991 [Boletus edulis BED1]
MSSPAARAQARRKAILSRGGDRLAKLTTSARGEDASANLHDDAPARRSAAFVGEETNMPPPPPPPKDTPRPSPPPPAFTAPSVWSEEQQHEFMQALMGGALNPSGSFPSLPPPPPSFETPPRANDPFATMMAQMSSVNAAQGVAGKAPTLPKPPTRLHKWMPLLHLVCMWCFLAFFVLWKEPQVFVEKTAGAVEVAFWKRWPKLVNQGTFEGTWGVQVVSFFWAFMTLQVMLHSLRIFGGHNDTQPPALLTVVLPHLPPPLPSVILNGLGYLRMGNAFLDDMAAIVFGIGMLIVITSWFAD